MSRLIRAGVLLLLFFTLLLSVACQHDDGKRMFDRAMDQWEEQKYEEAIQNLIALTKAFPSHNLVDDSLFWIANIYEHYLKTPEQSIRFYRTLNKRHENSDYLFRSMRSLANIYSDQGEDGYRKALLIYQKLQKSVQSESELENILFELAQIYFKMAYYEQARITLKQLIEQFPKSLLVAKAYHIIGYSFYSEGNVELAILTYQEIEKKFGYTRISLATAISLAEIYEEQGHLSSAISTYQSILNRLERKEVFFQLAQDRIDHLKKRLIKTTTGQDY